MGMRVNTNMAAISALRNFSKPQLRLGNSLSKLSSGSRIPSANFDAAGLAIANRMSAETRGYSQSMRNASDGISLVQTAEGGQSQISENLQRVRELSMQAANGTLNSQDREAIQAEVDGLVAEIDRVSQSTEFNGQALTDGSFDDNIAVGDSAADQINVSIDDASSSAIGVDSLDMSSPAGAMAALASIDTAIDQVSSMRAENGATMNRLTSSVNNLQTAHENLSAAKSRIMDVDYAAEMSNFTKDKIISQASLAVMSQANYMPKQALSLLNS